MIRSCTKLSFSVYFLFYSRFMHFRSNSFAFQIEYISVSDPIHIRYIYCCTKLSCSVCFLLLLLIYPFQIQFILISDPIHIHFRSITYMFELLCVFPVFTPDSDFVFRCVSTSRFHKFCLSVWVSVCLSPILIRNLKNDQVWSGMIRSGQE